MKGPIRLDVELAAKDAHDGFMPFRRRGSGGRGGTIEVVEGLGAK